MNLFCLFQAEFPVPITQSGNITKGIGERASMSWKLPFIGNRDEDRRLIFYHDNVSIADIFLHNFNINAYNHANSLSKIRIRLTRPGRDEWRLYNVNTTLNDSGSYTCCLSTNETQKCSTSSYLVVMAVKGK